MKVLALKPSRLFIRRVIRNYRCISKYLDQDKNCKAIRQKFLDYFVNKNNHTFVRSSPVIPYCDPSLAFINAGMNQFKGILMGNQEPKHKKVANSQKCVRVGGKHNDLSVVGSDGYHHTFFEMLGNWSFEGLQKFDACKMALILLTDVYKIPMSRLYVTYFKGDQQLGIPEDTETKEVWKSLGIPETRILPFGATDNFWEMGNMGPCGPCTEIHYDHLGSVNRASFVNKGLFDLTEIWNLVFLEYKRNETGELEPLPKKHLDTGMGLERLTSVLQGKTSNYDTDIFSPLFTAIHKMSENVPKYGGKFGEKDWNQIDTSYRTLADHMRMVTACLADGAIPEQNQKLRRILRKCFIISENVFKREKHLPKELSNYVVESLGAAYPEMEKNINQIHQIIDYEEDVFKSVRKYATHEWKKLVGDNKALLNLEILETPSLVGAYREIKRIQPSEISGKLAFKLYDTFGLDKEVINKLAQTLELPFDEQDLQKELDAAKERSKKAAMYTFNVQTQLELAGTPKTDDSAKYLYTKEQDEYVFPELKVKVLKILHNNQMEKHIGPRALCTLVLDKTNFYAEAGGQSYDKGTISFPQGIFVIDQVHNFNNYVLHSGLLKCDGNCKLQINDEGVMKVDPKTRLNHMRNHTATHLLNAALKKIKGATCQKSSKITDNHLRLDVAIFGPKLILMNICNIEADIRQIIDKKLPVSCKKITSQEFQTLDGVTVIPGEVYPECDIRIIEVDQKGGLVSREPCCGTHVLNTSDLGDFCIINTKSLGRSTVSIYAVTGERAKQAQQNAVEMLDKIYMLQKSVDDNMDNPEVLNMAVTGLKQSLSYDIEQDTQILPLIVKHECMEKLENISKQIKEKARENLKEFVEMEIKSVLESNVGKTKNNKEYVIHYLRSSMILDSVPLQNATRLCPDKPILVISYSDNMVKARCCVPKHYCNRQFNAENWLRSVANVFKGSTIGQKGHDANLMCNMRSKKVNIQEWDTLLSQCISEAKRYVNENL